MNSLTSSLLPNVKPSLKDITWEIEGEKIFSAKNKSSLSLEEKHMVKVLILKGTPPDKRKKMWLLCSRALWEMNNNKNYYGKLVELSIIVPSLYETQIELDIRRTYPEDPVVANDLFLTQLRRILICYSIRNSSIGYCQGFNFIAGRLLKIVEDEEETFWLLCQLLEDILPLNYYSELVGIITDTTMINLFLKKFMPALCEFFTNNSFELSVNNFIHKWLVSLFTQNFNDETSLLIWDFLFLEGNIVLIKSCLAVFSILKKAIMEHDSNFEEIYYVLNDCTSEIKNSRPLLHYLALKKFEFNEDYIQKLRGMLQLSIIENLRNENSHKSKSLGIRNYYSDNSSMISSPKKMIKKCNPTWPYCLYDETFEAMKDSIQYLVLTLKKTPLIITDYYYEKQIKYPNSFESIDEYFNDYDNDLLLERRSHYCEDIKLVDNSAILLIPDNIISSKRPSVIVGERRKSISFFEEPKKKSKKHEREVRVLYDKINKGEKFKMTKSIIMSTFTPKPFLDIENEFE